MKVFFEEARRKEEGRINCATPRLTFPSESVPPQGFQRSCFKQGPKKRSHSWILDANPDPTYRTAGVLLPAEFSTLSRPGLLRTTPQVASSSQRTEPLSALSFLSPGTVCQAGAQRKFAAAIRDCPFQMYEFILFLFETHLYTRGEIQAWLRQLSEPLMHCSEKYWDSSKHIQDTAKFNESSYFCL